MKLYSIYDKKGCLFSPPYCSPHNASAVRVFMDLVSDKQSTISKFPEDFSLYYIGEFLDDVGTLAQISNPSFLHDAVEFLKIKPEQAG